MFGNGGLGLRAVMSRPIVHKPKSSRPSLRLIDLDSCRREADTKESIATLESLLRLARAGEIRGIAVCAMGTDNVEHIAFAGEYRRVPAKAVNAATRMAWRMTQMQEEADAQH